MTHNNENLYQQIQYTVLILDSDPAVRRSLAKELYLIDMRVFSFSNAGRRRKLLKQIIPDLIILEQNPSGQSSAELCAELENGSTLPLDTYLYPVLSN